MPRKLTPILLLLIFVFGACRSTSAPRPIALNVLATKAGLEDTASLPPEPSATPLPPTRTPRPTVTPRTSQTPLPTATLSPVEPMTPEGFLGDLSAAGGLGIAALQVQNPGVPGPLFGPLPGMRLTAVQVLVRNYQADAFRVEAQLFTLVDRFGNAFHPDLSALDPLFQTVILSPGEQCLVWLGYQIPELAEPSYLLADSLLTDSDGLVVSLLNPPEGHTPESEPLPAFAPGARWSLAANAGGLQLEALKFEDPSTPLPTYIRRPGHRLVAVQLDAANISQERLDLDLTRAFLVDESGYVYAAELLGRADQMDGRPMSANAERQGWISFTLPEEAKPSLFKYYPEVDLEAEIRLGLKR